MPRTCLAQPEYKKNNINEIEREESARDLPRGSRAESYGCGPRPSFTMYALPAYISILSRLSLPSNLTPRLHASSALPVIASKYAQFIDKKSQLDIRTSVPRNPH
jgi:hypothetical protein